MIHRLLRATLFLPLLLAISGCPEETYVSPPNGPSRSNNTWILGVWETARVEGGTKRAVVRPTRSDRVVVIYTEVDEKQRTVAEFTAQAWISRVGRATLLTMQLPPAAPGGAFSYGLIGYQLLSPLVVRVREVTLTEEARVVDSLQLRRFIRRAFAEGTLFRGRDEIWNKVGEVFWNPAGNPATDQFAPPRNLP